MVKYRQGGKECEDSAIEDAGDAIEMEMVDEGVRTNEDECSILNTPHPIASQPRPFSSVTNLEIISQYFEEAEESFDEFGFRKREAEVDVDPTAEGVPIETTQQRMRWLAHIQFAHDEVEKDLTWSAVNMARVKDDTKFEELLNGSGIPHSLRRFLWPRLSGGTVKRLSAGCHYIGIVKKSERDGLNAVRIQIEKDLLRTLPSNYCFSKHESLGTKALRRVLRAIAFMHPEVGYCQGMGTVVATLLLVCSEENVFWLMCALIENTLPPNFYSHSLLGLRGDERLVRHLMQIHMPELSDLILSCETEMTLILVNWLLTLLSSCMEPRILFRLWDHLFTDGSITLFRAIISMLKLNEEILLEKSQQRSSTDFSLHLFAEINQIPSTVTDIDHLLEVMQTFRYSITVHLVDELRKKFQAKLTEDSGIIASCARNANLPKQLSARKKMERKPMQALFAQLFARGQQADDAEDPNDPKMKNVRQTELLLDLRNAILEICRHFEHCPEEHKGRIITTQADYSASTTEKVDREQFFKTRREARKRARALLDFEKQAEDELGFSKNAIITIIDHQRDEHCWIGEFNGQRGWFPAKFVEVIDERGKNYCSAGDEEVDNAIVSLTRGPLALVLRRILFHGLHSASKIGNSFVPHPWSFIESMVGLFVEQHNPMTNSKLALCDTFRLDEKVKLLSPEELLLRAIYLWLMRIKCLHLWINLLCNDNQRTDMEELRRKYYHSWSFMRSPVSYQIVCELRLLAQFSFTLNVDSEIELDSDGSGQLASRLLGLKIALEQRKKAQMRKSGLDGALRRGGSVQQKHQQPLKEGVRDILIKHHLFSWDL